MLIVRRSTKKISVLDHEGNLVAEFEPHDHITIMYPDEYGEEVLMETKLVKHADDQAIKSYVEGSVCN